MCVDFGYSQFSEEDKTNILLLLNKVNGNCFAEIGCWAGNSTSIIAREANIRNGIVHVIDSFKGNDGTRLKEIAKVDDIKNIFLSNMEKCGVIDVIKIYAITSNEAVELFENNSLDFLFIDGDHTYKGVSDDLKNWFPKVKNGGMICGHDFNGMDYIDKYINIDCVNGVHHGLTKAIVEFFNKDFNVIGRLWWKIK